MQEVVDVAQQVMSSAKESRGEHFSGSPFNRAFLGVNEQRFYREVLFI